MDIEQQRRLAIRAQVVVGLLMALVSLGLGLTRLVPLPGRVDLVLATFLGTGAIACLVGALWTFYVRPPGASRK